MALFSKFFGKTISESAAFALGGAMRSPLEPPLAELTNETWITFVDAGITLPTDPGDAAEIAAEDVASVDWAKGQAKQRGIGGDQMDKLIAARRIAPGLGTLYEAWRRGFIGYEDFVHGLNKARLEDRWTAALEKMKDRLPDLEPLAQGIQRGLVAAPFTLPYTPAGAGGVIPAFPPANVDAQQVTEGLGYSLDYLYLQTALAGNPPGPQALYRARFRNAINDVDVQRGLAEGRSRQEWAPAFEADARAIPSPANFVEAFVRNWIKQPDMLAGTARHGMSPEDSNLLFLIHGRPLTHNQVFIGLLRGGVYDGPTTDIDPPFLKSLQESDMRPEWYNLAWHARFHFPPFFQTINALNKGWIDGPTATQWLLWQAYDPTAVKTIVDNVTGSKTAPKDSRVASAQTKLLTGIEKAYVGGTLDDSQATAQLTQAGLSATTAAGVLAHWKQLKAVEAIPPPPAA